MKKRKKIIYVLGTLALVSTPISIAISCSKTQIPSITMDQQKMNGITSDMIKSALNITPNSSILPSDAKKTILKTKVATLNGLDGVTITNIVFTGNDTGTLLINSAISKKGLNPPKDNPFHISYNGYQTQYEHDQILMNGITSDMVKSALNITPSSTTLPSAATPPITKHNVILNGVEGITITVQSVTLDDEKGIIKAKVAISKEELQPPLGNPFTLTWTGFLTNDQNTLNHITADTVKKAMGISPNNSYWSNEISKPNDQNVSFGKLNNVIIHVDKWTPNVAEGTITASIIISKIGLNSPKPFTIVWTGYKKETTLTWEKLTVMPTSILIGEGSNIIRVNINTILVATKDKGFFKVDISNPNWVWTHLSPPGLTDLSGYSSSSVKVNNDYLLVGTYDKGFYKVNISSAIWTWTPISVTGFDINVAKYSSIAKIYSNTLLVGTNNQGFYKVDTSSNVWSWKKEKTDFPLSVGNNSSIINLNYENLLVGTNNFGFYKVNISLSTWRWSRLSPSGLTSSSSWTSKFVKLSDGTLFVSTNDRGFYKVHFNSSTLTWEQMAPPNLQGYSGQGASIAQIDKNTLIASTNNQGFYKIDTSTEKWKWTHTLPASETFGSAVGRGSSILNLKNGNLLIGTNNKGFYRIKF